MRPTFTVFACLAFAVGLTVGVDAIRHGAQAATARPVVVELFTSEGCSSCPPADRLLTELAGRGDLLPLAFHVTYWNALGWRDPFSTQAATDRQAAYAARLGGGSYTPEIVVDGRRGMVGSERDEVAAAIAASRAEAGASPSLAVTRAGDAVEVRIGAGHGSGRVLLVGFDPRHETAIGRGENSGRTLVESNIVRSLQTVGGWSGRDLALTARAGAGREVAVLLQAPDGRIIGAGRP